MYLHYRPPYMYVILSIIFRELIDMHTNIILFLQPFHEAYNVG